MITVKIKTIINVTKINKLNQEIFQLKKEKDILELTNNNLLSEIEKINQNKTSQNQKMGKK